MYIYIYILCCALHCALCRTVLLCCAARLYGPLCFTPFRFISVLLFFVLCSIVLCSPEATQSSTCYIKLQHNLNSWWFLVLPSCLQ